MPALQALCGSWLFKLDVIKKMSEKSCFVLGVFHGKKASILTGIGRLFRSTTYDTSQQTTQEGLPIMFPDMVRKCIKIKLI